MIVAAAVVIDGTVRALPAPARHHNVMHDYPLPQHEHGEQGFIDHEFGFVGRITAAQIALAEGQVKRLRWGPGLFSEDLW